MSRRRDRRRAGPTLSVQPALVAALDALHGPLDSKIPQLARGVAALQAGLTRDRARFVGGGYLRQAALREAYATYYLCANAPKLVTTLDHVLARGLLPEPPTLRVLELGCGPGTGVAAAGLWGRAHGFDVQHTAVDAQPAALAATRRLAAQLKLPTPTTHAQRLPAPLPAGTYDLLLMMNVVNELPDAADAGLVGLAARHLSARGLILVIEPAARGPSRRALRLRDALAAEGWRLPLPCPHDRACPARAAADDWCHDEWPFARPPFMTAVDAQVGTRREVLKATWFAATRGPAPRPEGPLVRVVGARVDEKGRCHAPVCAHDGRRRTLELQRRDQRPQNAALASVSRFDLLRVEDGTPVGERLRLGPEARCTRVEPR